MRALEMFGEPIANGGQEVYAARVVSRLHGRGAVFDALTPYSVQNEELARMITGGEGTAYSFGLPFEPGKNRFALIRPLKEFFARNAYDVVHIHSGSISALAEGASAARAAGTGKVIVHSHCAALRPTLKSRLVKALFAPAMNKATHFAACSRAAGEAKFSARICRERLILLKNGVDTDEFAFNGAKRAQVRKALSLTDDCLLLGNVGRFSFQKNQEYLLGVLGELLRRGIDCRLIYIGTGETEDAVRSECAARGLESRVVFAGNTDRVSDYMQAMDVFMLPSRFEGLPIVGVEAQAAGLPCVFGDAITREAALTLHVKYLGTDDCDISAWADAAESFAGARGESAAEDLRAAGFDIGSAAEAVWQLYES